MKALRKYDGLELLFDARTILVHEKKAPNGKKLVKMIGGLASYEDGDSEVKFYKDHPFQWVSTKFIDHLLTQQEPEFKLAQVADAHDFYYGD